jgi:hypothetical protein
LRRLEYVRENCRSFAVFSYSIRRVCPLVVAAFAALAGVQGVHAQEGMFDQHKGQKPVDAKPTEKPAPKELAPVAKQSGGWTIVLAAFRGETRDLRGNLEQENDARAMLEKVIEQKELSGAFVESRGGGKSTVVAVGRFADPSSPEALAKLEKVRELVIGDKKPFAGAFLAPPGELTSLGQRPEFNLVRAKEQYGTRAQYTLQVGVYGRKDILDKEKRNPTEEELKDARKSAEEAVAALRKEGELAFFFHGPRYSTVTIGVWNDKDFASRPAPGSDERPRSENPELTALRQRFPNNLYNGAGLKVTTKDNKEEIQPSVMVRIPER